MIGLPSQSIDDVEESLNKIIEHNPEHISVYSLIVEEGTPLFDDVNSGKVELPSEELERMMYWKVKNVLEEHGYMHYEISNFAKSGLESRHNINCWEQEEYIGIGVAAHSYTNGVRYSNVDRIEKYIENFESDNEVDNLIFHEKQNRDSMMKEYMMLGLRKIRGVSIQVFKSKFGENPIYLFRKELEKLSGEGLVEIDGDFIKLTEKGIDFGNLVFGEFV